MTATTTERHDYREMYCGECEEYVTTVLVNDETEECPTHGDDCNLFDTESDWVDALRSDHDEMMWQADREEF
jgi:hypothetical protein